MSRVFEAPRDGLNYDVYGGSVPNSMLYRIKQIEGLSKQTLSIVPSSGQGIVYNGNKIIVSLPMNSLLDLGTFEMNFYGKTAHNGAASGNQKNYVQTRYFPRNIQSLISNLEVKINGRSVQNITQYNYIYNVLNDYLCGTDATNKKRVGENADPSNKSAWVEGVNIPRRGYPIGLYNANSLSVDDKFDASARDADNYTIRNWLGLLSGGASTNIIHTDMYGQIDIEITLDQAGVLMLGQSTATAAAGSLDTVLNSTNYGFLGDIATSNGGAVASEAAQYVLSNIGFNIVRMDMPAYFYEAMANVLASGVVYKLYYPNYQIFTGQSTTNKSGTTRFSITTKSLDYCIGTFQVANRDTISTVLNSGIAAATAGEYGNASFTSGALINSGAQRVFNNSKYFARNGSGVKNGTWYAGSVKLISETPLQMYNGILRGFNMKNDLLGGTSPYIRHYGDFVETTFGHMISFEATGETDMYTISGLDSSQQPLSIAWEIIGGDTVSDGSTGLVGIKSGTKILNDGVVCQKNDSCLPVVIAAYSSHLEVTAGRNIQLFS
jgi:hypothetical protein